MATKKPIKKTEKKSTKKIPDNVNPETGEIIDPKAAESQAVEIPDNVNPEPEASTESALTTQPQREAALSIVGGVSTEELSRALTVQTEQRKLIQQFIQDNLVEGIDYGKIHVVTSCVQEKQAAGSCSKDYHFSKSILFKPGQEKIFSLFGITDELKKDQDAYDVLNVPGMVAYLCIMYRGDKKVGEGRGAATLAESQNKPNSTIKKAEKRARMDACLSLGFSAYFTQDLDDPDYKSQRDHMNEQAKYRAEEQDKDENGFLPRPENDPIDNKERALLHKLITGAGFEDRSEIIDFLKSNGIADPGAMTSGQARKLIKKMQASEFLGPEKSPLEPANDVGDDPIVIPPKPVEEAELVVDEDLKAHLQTEFEKLGLNARGEIYFKKYTTGKPFGGPEKYSDQDWRKIYAYIEEIKSGRSTIDPDHLLNPDDQTADLPDDEPAGLDIDPDQDRMEDREIQEALEMDFNQNNNDEEDHSHEQ